LNLLQICTVALCFLGLLAGCGGKKHPPIFISETGTGGRSGASGGGGGPSLDPNSGSDDAGALDSAGAGSDPSGGSQGVAHSGEFETNDVFVIDSLKDVYIPVIARVTTPNDYSYGLERFGNPADTYVAKFLGRSLIYDLGPGTKLRTFVPDLVGSPKRPRGILLQQRCAQRGRRALHAGHLPRCYRVRAGHARRTERDLLHA